MYFTGGPHIINWPIGYMQFTTPWGKRLALSMWHNLFLEILKSWRRQLLRGQSSRKTTGSLLLSSLLSLMRLEFCHWHSLPNLTTIENLSWTGRPQSSGERFHFGQEVSQVYKYQRSTHQDSSKEKRGWISILWSHVGCLNSCEGGTDRPWLLV